MKTKLSTNHAYTNFGGKKGTSEFSRLMEINHFSVPISTASFSQKTEEERKALKKAMKKTQCGKHAPLKQDLVPNE